jgi:hypothetical protein
MSNIKVGDKVKWIDSHSVVPHPDGKTGWDWNSESGESVLPVLAEREIFGTVTGTNGKKGTYQVRPDSKNMLSLTYPSSYDLKINPTELTKI